MRRNNKQVTTYFILFSLLLIGVVYAILQANLQINGTAKIKSNTWDIHFNNIQINENSVPIGTGDSPATIDPENNCKVDFEITLSLPGDFYEFTIDIVNAGTIDGMIGELNKTLIVNETAVENLPDFLDYRVTYIDGIEIVENHKLDAGSTETYKVRLEFKSDIEELPLATTISTSLTPQYIQADSSSVPVRVTADFATDSWEDIIDSYRGGRTSKLQEALAAGTTRNIDLGTLGIHPVRIANLSKPAECSTTGFSQTACGFVIEFADIITTHRMNKCDNNGNSVGDGNNGGWEYSDMRAYLNSGKYLEGQTEEIDYTSGGIFNALPEGLRNSIIDTTVVSGYASKDSSNFTTTDKIYLLSTHEVWEDVDGNTTSGIDYYDKAYNNTRQLDYYENLNVTTSSYASAIKQQNRTNAVWWLRSARSHDSTSFDTVSNTGNYPNRNAKLTYGVSPAFRIA
ncbi:MAG: hypothetical protein IJG68_06345 [Bacilli bacterium]|nr:hypothetical protein [Bacilli bacterium]